MEFRCTRQVLDVPIASRLVQLVRAETRACSRRVGLNGIALIEVALFVELLEQVPQRLDILVVIGDIRIIEIYPITHLLRQVRPLFRVFHYLATASGVVFIYADLLADILFRDTEHLLYAQLYRQTMGIPSRFTTNLIALHRLKAAERILNRTRHHVVNTRHTVR